MIKNAKEFANKHYKLDESNISSVSIESAINFAEKYHTLQLLQTAVSSSFYSLIDRLQRHSEWKYPNRKWTNDFYYECAFQWLGKEQELKEKVLKLEDDMRLAGAL